MEKKTRKTYSEETYDLSNAHVHDVLILHNAVDNQAGAEGKALDHGALEGVDVG